VGCGEKRYLPSGIRDELDKVLKSYSASMGGLPGAFALVGEVLDTPAFRQEDVNNLCEVIQDLDPTVLPIVLSHHNLLPQAFLRFEMYTELINSGFVRSRLAKLNRPLIYCHGHIHSNPVEVIRSGENRDSSILCVAAPELSEGFNILRIYYSSKHYPLGCEIRQFEFDNHDGAVTETKRRMPFAASAGRSLRSMAHDALPKILSRLSEKEVRFSELVRNLPISSGGKDPNALEIALQEAEWFGLIEVSNREDDVANWNLRRLPR
jgi:hypothetical protein